MSPTAICPDCGKTAKTKPGLIGKRVRCKGCKSVFRIEAEAEPDATLDAVHSSDSDQTLESTSDAAPSSMNLHDARTLWGNTWSDRVESDADITMSIKAPHPPGHPTPAGREDLRRSQASRLGQPGGATSLPGKRFSTRADFTLQSTIGQGGMGAIHRAKQESLSRNLAIKTILPAHAGDDSTRNKFTAEALVTGELDHPNIVPVYELGTNEDNTLFYAMKEVTGSCWKDVLPRKTEAENLRIQNIHQLPAYR
ncbi:MAG: protein kinase domain-containing protein [Planctomycetota bacterium]|jgi:hypothetical protein